MRRAARIDSTASALVKHARKLDAKFYPINWTIDGLLLRDAGRASRAGSTRKVWGVVFHNGSGLLHGGWHPVLQFPRYDGEPVRAVLFTTHRHARTYCAARHREWQQWGDSARLWRLRVVRVRETVEVQQ